MFTRSLRNTKGFTLIELLVVISIIAILVVVGAVSYSEAQKRARDAVRIGHMQDIQSAMEQAYGVNGTYPDFNDVTDSTCTAFTGLDSIPTDPKSGNTAYSCTNNAGHTTYWACATLEGSAGGNSSSTTGDNYPTGTTHFCVKEKQ